MATRRDFKKEINDSVNEFAGVCLNYMERHTGENALAVDELIDKAADLLDDIMNKVNNHSHLEPGKETRAYFERLEQEFDKGLEELYAHYKTVTV